MVETPHPASLGVARGHSGSLLVGSSPSPLGPPLLQINSGCIDYATGSRDDRSRNVNPLKCGEDDAIVLVLDPGTIVILVAPSFLRAYGNRQLGDLPGYRGVPPPTLRLVAQGIQECVRCMGNQSPMTATVENKPKASFASLVALLSGDANQSGW